MGSVSMLRAVLLASLASGLGGCDVDIHLGKSGSSETNGRTLKMVAQPGNMGWAIVFTGLAREPESFRVKVGDGEFSDYRRGVMTLPADTPASTITIYYTLNGKEHGPLEFEFNPDQANLDFGKDALDMVRTGWVSWRDFDGRTLVYFSALHMYTCALKKVEYGFDGELDQEWKLPPCRGPSARIGDEPISRDAPKGARSISVRLTFVDGEQTEIQTIKRP